MNTIWKFSNTTGIIIFFNPIIGNTSSATMNRSNGFQIISAPIRQNGRMINSILSTKKPDNEQERYIPALEHHLLQSEHCSGERSRRGATHRCGFRLPFPKLRTLGKFTTLTREWQTHQHEGIMYGKDYEMNMKSMFESPLSNGSLS
jgi:hypothetical protein